MIVKQSAYQNIGSKPRENQPQGNCHMSPGSMVNHSGFLPQLSMRRHRSGTRSARLSVRNRVGFPLRKGGDLMLRWALLFLVIALVAGILGLFHVQFIAAE